MNFRTLAYRSLITVHRSLITVHRSLLTVHRSLITVHRSLITVHRSLITVHRSLFTVCCLLFTAYCLPLTVVAGTELGATDDFTVLGTDGTVDDPDVEIKGFTIFGSTNVLTHISTAAGNTVFNGAVEVSSDIYIVGKSTFIDNAYFAGAGNIFVNDGADGQILRYNSGGYLEWVDASSFGDDLGDHIATEQLQMGNYAIWSSSDITAARYQINGSTVVAILPGSESMGIGVNAGRVNTGDYNVFVGSAAGYSNTTGYRNSFVGYQAGYSNITGYDNAFLGAYAGYYNQTGASNAILGTEAGYGVSLNSFSSSTLMGYRAGYGLTTGSGNLLLGFQSGDNLTTGSRNIIIGHDKNAPTAVTDDHLNIGGVIYGDLSAGNVGIGITAPTAKLHVQAYEAGKYTLQVSTSSTAGNYSIAVSSEGITNIKNFAIENRVSDPASPVTGQVWLRVD